MTEEQSGLPFLGRELFTVCTVIDSRGDVGLGSLYGTRPANWVRWLEVDPAVDPAVKVQTNLCVCMVSFFKYWAWVLSTWLTCLPLSSIHTLLGIKHQAT